MDKQTIQAKIFQDFISKGNKSILPDFSYAGYEYGEKDIPSNNNIIPISEFGVFPDTGRDVTGQIQIAIDAVGSRGGGVLYFPKGRYDLNMKPDKPEYLKINHNHVVLRGEGSGRDGAVFYKHNRLLEEKLTWLSPGIIHTGADLHGNENFLSPKELPFAAHITQTAAKGSRILQVSDTSRLKRNECILLCMKNTDEEGKLARELFSPLELIPAWEEAYFAGKKGAISYQWLVEIDEIPDERHIRLKQPLRLDLSVQYEPFICNIEMLTGIGIESIRLESAWDGGDYYHHKNSEVDYGWSGICMHRVYHGWVRDVVIENYTQGVQLRDSRNVTVSQVEVLGHPGHYGMKCYAHACDCLFRDIAINSFRTHGVGIEGTNYGNVFSNIQFNEKTTEIDAHGGGAPCCNLFENITNVTKISGGGSPPNLPYSGHYNTFWNISYLHEAARKGFNTFWNEAYLSDDTAFKEDLINELFHAWEWTFHMKLKTLKDWRMYPKSILAGVYPVDPAKKVKIERSAENRSDSWGHVEALNQGKVEPESLYEAQLNFRLKRKK